VINPYTRQRIFVDKRLNKILRTSRQQFYDHCGVVNITESDQLFKTVSTLLKRDSNRVNWMMDLNPKKQEKKKRQSHHVIDQTF
jgi:hypothetical protein